MESDAQGNPGKFQAQEVLEEGCFLKKYRVKVDGKEYEVEIEELGKELAGEETSISTAKQQKKQNVAPSPRQTTKNVSPKITGAGEVKAPMAGKILRIQAKEGQEVKEGQLLLLLEAMKMENEIYAPKDGTIKEVLVKEEMNVTPGDVMIKME